MLLVYYLFILTYIVLSQLYYIYILFVLYVIILSIFSCLFYCYTAIFPTLYSQYTNKNPPKKRPLKTEKKHLTFTKKLRIFKRNRGPIHRKPPIIIKLKQGAALLNNIYFPFYLYFKMILREIKTCQNCGIKTRNHYPIQTNKGVLYRCAECHENAVRKESRIYKLSTDKNSYEE